MASCTSLWVILAFLISSFQADEDLCTNQWDVKVEGVDKDLTIHHSSTFVPGLFTHLVWNWRQQAKPTGTLWLYQAQKSGKISGGFVGQLKSVLKLPASITWNLYNGSLSVSSHGDLQELNRYPAWKVMVCNELLTWGVTEDKELYVTYDEINESRSLDESWAVITDKRFKRQAEFPVVPEEPQKPNGTFASWWRRFVDSIGGSYQGDKPRSWILDLTELILKLIMSTARVQGGLPVTRNPDAEEIPRTNRDVESVTMNGHPVLDIPRRIN